MRFNHLDPIAFDNASEEVARKGLWWAITLNVLTFVRTADLDVVDGDRLDVFKLKLAGKMARTTECGLPHFFIILGEITSHERASIILMSRRPNELDNTHLMRTAGGFSRRVRAWAQAHGVPVIDCGGEERKHPIAKEHLKKNHCVRGLFLILVGRAAATVWDVKRSSTGVIQNLEAKRPFINRYSFHIMDPEWGQVTIKMAGHPRLGHRSFSTVMNTWPVKLGTQAFHLQRRVTVLLFCPI